jgi:glycosyltransferase involved in cell wall biosynthesis
MNERSRPMPSISLIIPTRNRADSLCATLDSIARQKYVGADFEVIVVDDGSTDETPHIATRAFPFKLIYLAQPWQGATAARNFGAQNSRGEILVFQDDDIELLPDALSALVDEQAQQSQTIVIGTLLKTDATSHAAQNEEVTFSSCFTGLLCVKRVDFIALGMFQDPTNGWPSWDDIAFGYLAQAAGYRILRAGSARGIHHDLAATSLDSAAHREYRSSKSAVRLFQKYPEIRVHLRMFYDTTPIDWRRDPAGLIGRKLLRRVTSTRLALAVLRRLVQFLERHELAAQLIPHFKRWYVGGYIAQGYRDGLREYGPVQA